MDKNDANVHKIGAGAQPKGGKMASAARKDPAVLPLACLVVLTWGCAIYMFSNKTSEEAVRTKVPEKALMPKLPPTSKTSASMTSQLGMSGSIFGDLASRFRQ